MPIETVGGLKFHTQVLGDAGPPVVMLHGIGGSLANWYFLAGPAIARDHRVFLYDMRGHGLSDITPTGYGVRSLAEDLRLLMDRRFADGAPFTLIGHSYSAIVALRFALDHPRLVERLVIVEGPLPITRSATVDVLLRDARRDAGEDDDAEITPEFIERTVNESVALSLTTFTAAQQDAFKVKGRRGRRLVSRALTLVQDTTALADVVAEPDIPDAELATLRCPVLLCYGTRTLPVFTQTCARLAAVLPDARVRMFDAGHFLPGEQPRPLAAAIREFLDG